MKLTSSHRRWLYTAHPITWILAENAAGHIVLECLALGLIQEGPRSGQWKLTQAGGVVWRKLCGMG
ncbi:hypothetical protein [Azospirillum sp. SYSU D00513]|uniref:hypothetical protein n=1 Tax=Azospirillum sp. SYSU D00513 TaxID=2812561 RepID=UPI001A964C57|nr:hypothetical protein [Azospirillum sp. SYSU D00513]